MKCSPPESPAGREANTKNSQCKCQPPQIAGFPLSKSSQALSRHHKPRAILSWRPLAPIPYTSIHAPTEAQAFSTRQAVWHPARCLRYCRLDLGGRVVAWLGIRPPSDRGLWCAGQCAHVPLCHALATSRLEKSHLGYHGPGYSQLRIS
jgi:hypothetical protein